MRREEHVDYHLVPDEHLAIHARLEAWARWVRVRPVGWQVTPMFRQYRSNGWQWERPEIRTAVNIPEAWEMEEAVRALDPKQRDAIRWCYVTAGSPVAMARRLEVDKRGLLALIQAGRAVLVGRL